MKEIFTAKSIEEAKHLAAEKFGVSEDQIVYRILEEPKKGLFGKIKREAQVEAVYEEPAAAAAPETPAETPAAPVSQPVLEAVSSVEEIVIDKDDNSPTRGMESEAIEDILTEENPRPAPCKTVYCRHLRSNGHYCDHYYHAHRKRHPHGTAQRQ